MTQPQEQGKGRPDGRRSEARGTARERLLDAAARVFSERGFAAASVDEVVADAGLTKGALYWHFDSKEELFFALIEERVDRRLRALMELTESASKQEQTAPQVSQGISDLLGEQRQLVLLLNECRSLALRDPELQQRFAERQRRLREELARALDARHEITGVQLTVSSQRLATAMIALANGLALDRLADPQAVPDDLYGEMLSLIYDGLVHRASGGINDLPSSSG